MAASRRAELVQILAANPRQGDVIVGSGGIRKLRFGGHGKGKRGAYRVMFAYFGEDAPVYILAVLKKNIRADFLASRAHSHEADREWNRRRMESEECNMSKAFDLVIAGLGEALEHAKGNCHLRVHVPDQIDVKAIRMKSKLSQPKFADTIGVKVGTLRNWEQNRREPEGPARVLLAMIDRRPSIVEETLKLKPRENKPRAA